MNQSFTQFVSPHLPGGPYGAGRRDERGEQLGQRGSFGGVRSVVAGRRPLRFLQQFSLRRDAPGEAGDNPINTIVNATDEIVARNFQHSAVDPALIDDRYDYNRDGLVNGTDQIIARENQTNPLTMLRLITAPDTDAIAKQAAELESFSSRISSADLDWLYEFEQFSTKRDALKKSKSVEATVDRLMVSDWA
ncbi:MAG: hypothetical protein V3R99_01540 [Thermoguttaceae bacterium]